jgi:SAM-dependent methyltransferase
MVRRSDRSLRFRIAPNLPVFREVHDEPEPLPFPAIHPPARPWPGGERDRRRRGLEMKRWLRDILICPACLPKETSLGCDIRHADGDEILFGHLVCRRCDRQYPIRDGIATLLPETDPDDGAPAYRGDAAVSAYLWSHYGHIMGDEDATNAYRVWAEQLRSENGLALDLGCATGRFTFEMSLSNDMAVGIDRSPELIRWARRLMSREEGGTVFSLRVEGELTERRVIRPPAHWKTERVEFLVGDATALPFPAGVAGTVASLNVIDKVARPLRHLQETNRVARKRDARLIFSDPFSWSREFSPPERWLGGLETGAFPGRGIANVQALLQGKNRVLRPPWSVVQQGHVWWRIRNHQNHFEQIRSYYLTGVR